MCWTGGQGSCTAKARVAATAVVDLAGKAEGGPEGMERAGCWGAGTAVGRAAAREAVHLAERERMELVEVAEVREVSAVEAEAEAVEVRGEGKAEEERLAGTGAATAGVAVRRVVRLSSMRCRRMTSRQKCRCWVP